MSKENRYRLRQKRYRNFFLFYIVIVIIVFSSYTFSRYTQTVTSTKATISVAQFNVKVNDQLVNENNEFKLTLNPSTNEEKINTSNYKMAPNSERRFDIILDPTGTEVGLEYELTFNISDPNIEVIKYSLDGGKTFKTDVENNIIKGVILITDYNRPLNESEKVTVSAYLKWNEKEDIYNPTYTEDNSIVTVNCLIKQKIN